MISPREAVEQAIFVAVGAASLTRDRAQAIVDAVKRLTVRDKTAIGVFDVVEHIEDDVKFLKHLHDLL